MNYMKLGKEAAWLSAAVACGFTVSQGLEILKIDPEMAHPALEIVPAAVGFVIPYVARWLDAPPRERYSYLSSLCEDNR